MLAAFAVLTAASIATAAAAGPVAATTPAGKLSALRAGLAARMSEAAVNLSPGGDRLKATRALDAARRLGRVERALVACPGGSSEGPLRAVNAARHDLQIGRADVAVQILRNAASDLALPPSETAAPQTCSATAGAVGKLVVNARGERLGRLTQLGDPRTPESDAKVKTGEVVNWLGFIDFANGAVAVPAASLVEGDRMVVVATLATAEQLPKAGD
jgi:hypothetical protein